MPRAQATVQPQPAAESATAEATAVVKVPSDKALSERVQRTLQRKMSQAAAALDKTGKVAVDAWVWAIQHGFDKYRPTLKTAGVEPSGWLQAAYNVARAVVGLEATFEDVAAAAGTENLAKMATAARDMLKEHGLIAEPKRTVRTSRQVADKAVDAILRFMEQIETAPEKRVKRVPFPTLSTIPVFNVREIVLARLSGQAAEPVLAADAAYQNVAAAVQASK